LNTTWRLGQDTRISSSLVSLMYEAIFPAI
jgi:hypothetical protein